MEKDQILPLGISKRIRLFLSVVLAMFALLLGAWVTIAFDRGWHLSAKTLAGKPKDRLQVPNGAIAVGYIDFDNGKPEYLGVSGSNLAIHGWVASAIPSVPVQSIEIVVDSRVAGKTSSFQSRPDVADAFDRPDFEMSGWHVVIPLQDIASGSHSLGARAILADGRKFDLTPLTLIVT